jgi:hypothetical protein
MWTEVVNEVSKSWHRAPSNKKFTLQYNYWILHAFYPMNRTKPEYGFVKTSLELNERTLHSGVCDTADQFITRAFRADFNTATEKEK